MRNYNEVDLTVFFSQLERTSLDLEKSLFDRRTAVDVSTKTSYEFKFSSRISNLSLKLQLLLLATTHYWSDQDLAWLYRGAWERNQYPKLSDEDKFFSEFFTGERWRLELWLQEQNLWSDSEIFRNIGNVRKQIVAEAKPLRLVLKVPGKPKKPKRKLGYDDFGNLVEKHHSEPRWKPYQPKPRTVREQRLVEKSQRDSRSLAEGVFGLELKN